ncbi:putative Ubiquitin-conjugating enzyme [Seiridium cardinale]|uniref:Ubiquitin-conjugating enzyme E2 2 n=1 Tax=Seiridium cardinale TaxID=138064 RepID=A0ABR2X709_9PEZI
MLKIWSMKKEQQKADNADALSGKKRKVKAAELRVQKGETLFHWPRRVCDTRRRHQGSSKPANRVFFLPDLSELSLGNSMKLEYKEADDILNFKLIITPDDGLYKGGQFPFDVAIPQSYPHEPPKVHCVPTVYHPNIDLEGNVCLNILREDWKPVLNLNAIFYGLQYLFLQPNDTDPLNKDAAEEMRKNKANFEANVRRAMAGKKIQSSNQRPDVEYTRVLVG